MHHSQSQCMRHIENMHTGNWNDWILMLCAPITSDVFQLVNRSHRRSELVICALSSSKWNDIWTIFVSVRTHFWYAQHRTTTKLWLLSSRAELLLRVGYYSFFAKQTNVSTGVRTRNNSSHDFYRTKFVRNGKSTKARIHKNVEKKE